MRWLKGHIISTWEISIALKGKRDIHEGEEQPKGEKTSEKDSKKHPSKGENKKS